MQYTIKFQGKTYFFPDDIPVDYMMTPDEKMWFLWQWAKFGGSQWSILQKYYKDKRGLIYKNTCSSAAGSLG